ncbi:MAG: efflux RND transporter periplasmic adaptor subunit, partial [Planctomycetales bacterium]
EIAHKQARNDIKIRTAKKGAEVAATELKRAREAVEKHKKSVSESELDKLRLMSEKAAFEVEQAQHEQEVAQIMTRLKETEQKLAEAAVERRRITAPLSGVIVQVQQHRGEWVQPGETVLRLMRIDRLRIEALVDVQKLPRDVTGSPATLTVDIPGHPASEYQGSVVYVSPEVNPVNNQVRVWAEVENHDRQLRPGLKGNLVIQPQPAGADGKKGE